jgi:hypothetical protein
MKIRVAGVWRDILGCKLRANGSWRTVIAVKIYSGGAWRNAASFSPTGTSGGMTVEIEGDRVDGTFGGHTATITTDQFQASPHNGSAPFSYSWSVTDSDGPGSVAVNSPSLARTTITATFTDVGTITATIECTATDAAGNTASDSTELTFIRS